MPELPAPMGAPPMLYLELSAPGRWTWLWSSGPLGRWTWLWSS